MKRNRKYVQNVRTMKRHIPINGLEKERSIGSLFSSMFGDALLRNKSYGS